MAKKVKAPKTSKLRPLFIPDLEIIEGNPEGFVGGIGLRNVESPFLVYVINPKDGVDPGIVATLHWVDRNVPVASTPIRPGDEDLELIPLTVPNHNIREFLANPVYAKLRHRSGNTSESDPVKLHVRLHRPGGEPGPQPGGHKGLEYVVPLEVVLHGVSEATALTGVKIIIRYWEHMRPYDLIRLVWGSQTVERRVQPGEEGTDIEVIVDYETIRAAGNNPLTRVAYQVRDAGGNLPAEGARFSRSTWLDVHLSEARPEAPWLAIPPTDPNRIDLSELGSWDALIELWVTNLELQAYTHVTLQWGGVDSEGNSVPYTPTVPLNRTGVYKFPIPNALVAAIADGTASVHALYQRAGGEQPSQKLYLEVFGQVIRWPAPRIREDLGGHVDPTSKATVYFGLQGSWAHNGLIEVIFRVSSPDNSIEHRVGREVDDVPPTADNDLEFVISSADLIRFDGYLVDVFYAYTQPGTDKAQESLRLQIIVGTLERTMPAPIVEKAFGGQLNPDDVGEYLPVHSTFKETQRLDWIRMFWIGRLARTEVPVQVAVTGATTVHDIEKFYVTNNRNERVAVFYTLTRGDNPPRYSQITEVLISRDLADLPAPTLLGADAIGPGTAELEPLKVPMGTKLVIEYPGMGDEDSIKPTMAGTANGGSPDIPAKPGNQALQKVEFDIYPGYIAANIRDVTTTVKFHYVVTRAGVPKTSGTLTVTFKPIPATELGKTVIQLNQANATTKVLDLSAFPGNATARIGIWPFILDTRPVWLRFLGKTASNVAHEHLLFNGAASAAVNPPWISAGQIEWPLPRTYLDGLGHGTKLTMQFKAAFSPSKVETDAVSFPLVEYTVSNIQIPDQFPVPKLTQATPTGATTATLAPMSAQTGGTVSVEFTPMYTTDKIKVTMIGTAGAGTPVIAEKNGLASGVQTFAIPKSAIAANIGNGNKTFTLKYEVTRSSVTMPSLTLTVTVTPIPQDSLPRALINYVPNSGALDITTFGANTRWRIGAYPFQASNEQRIWLDYCGVDASNKNVQLLPWQGALNGHAGAYEYNPDHNFFRTLKHGSQLSIEVRIAFDKVNNKALAVLFPPTLYTVSNNPIPDQFPVPKLTQATPTGATTATLAPMSAQTGGTVSVEFTPMYTTDKIKVTMIGTAGAGTPVIAEKNGLASGVQTFAIPKSAIAANIGNGNKTFTLKYEVTRSSVTKPSLTLTVTVTPIPQGSLPRALIDNVPNGGALNIATFGANTRWRIGAYPFQAPNEQLIWLDYRGVDANNNNVELLLWQGALNEHAGAFEYNPDHSFFRALKHGSQLSIEVRIAFDKVNNKALAVLFSPTLYTVSNNPMPDQFPVPKLTQATVTGATTATLAPLSAQADGTASVEYTPMYITDEINVRMIGTAGAGSPVIAVKNGLASGVQTFAIPKSAIAANIGNGNKTFTLEYEVTRNNVTKPSLKLTVTVTPIPTAELLKTILRINQANQTTKVLDLSAVTSGGTLHVGSWPFIAQSQPVAMVLNGFKENNAAHNRTVWTLPNNAVTAGWFNNKFYEELIPASYLNELGRNKTLSLVFKVSLNGTTVEANAITFPAMNYTIADTRPPSLSIAPTVNEADPYNNALSLLKPINGVTVIVPHYAGMWVGDDITLVWSGGSTGTQGKQVVTLGAQPISIPHSVITQSIGNTLNFFYNVKRSGGTVASPASPSLSIAVQNPILTGTVRFTTGTTSYYQVTPTSTQISVPSSTANNTVVASTNQVAASAETRGTGSNWNMGNVNLIGPQPSIASNIFPTNVKGIGMRFVRYTIPTNSSDYFNGGGLGPNTNGDASNGVNPLQRKMHVEFIKVGPVTTGTIAAGYIMQRVAGNNRLHFLGVQLMSAITFTAT